jgi:hypothetical protein
MTREELLADLDSATKAGDIELARVIDAKLNALNSAAPPRINPQSEPGVFSELSPFAHAMRLKDQLTFRTPEGIAGNPLTRFALGAGKPVVGAAQFLANAPGPVRNIWRQTANQVIDPVLESYKRTEAMGNLPGEFNAAGLTGEVMSPVSLGMSRFLGPVAGAPKKIGQGAVFGGMAAASQPVTDGDFMSTKFGQVTTGAAVGGAIPLTAEAVKWIGRPVIELVKYLTPGGADRLSKKWMGKTIGRENLDAIVADIESQLPSVGKGNVPAYRPTTPEMVSHIPEASPIIAMKNRVSAIPGLSGQFGRREFENQQAIRSALAPIAGTPEALIAAQKLADQRAAANYGPLMNREVSLASDVELLGEDIARARGIPWTAAGRSAFSGGVNQAPYTGKAGALQQAGMLQTEAAQQSNLANSWIPVSGMPRVAGRYSQNSERVGPAIAGANDALGMAARQGQKADFLERWLDVFKDKGSLTTESAAPLMQRPSMQNAIQYAKNLASERGYKFPASLDDNFTVQNLHDIKLGLDAQIRAGAAKGQPSSLDNSTLEAINGTKSQFLKWFESKVPAYGKARVEFSKDMVPVNRMQVGQALESKLVPPTDQMSPGNYLRAISDETKLVKTSTGQPRSDLGGIFNPRERETVADIGNLLERKLASQKPLQATNLTGHNAAQETSIDLPALLSRPVVLANFIIKKLSGGTGGIERKIDELNAIRMLNPEAFVAAYKSMPPGQAQQIQAMLERQGVNVMNQGFIAPSVTGLLGTN